MSAFGKGFSSYGEFRRRQQHIPWGAVSTVIVPPFDAVHNVWSFDPDGVGAAQYIAGPTGTVTTPVQTIGTPSKYTFGSTDYIDFGNSLESTWDTAAGYTIYVCVQPSSADLAVADAPILSKRIGGVSAEIYLGLNATKFDFYTVYGGGNFVNYTAYAGTPAAITAGTRYVVAISFDATKARDLRALIYVNSAAASMSVVDTGTDGTVAATAGTVRLGVCSGVALNPVSTISYTYAYSAAHSPSTITSITNWLQTTKGWV